MEETQARSLLSRLPSAEQFNPAIFVDQYVLSNAQSGKGCSGWSEAGPHQAGPHQAGAHRAPKGTNMHVQLLYVPPSHSSFYAYRIFVRTTCGEHKVLVTEVHLFSDEEGSRRYDDAWFMLRTDKASITWVLSKEEVPVLDQMCKLCETVGRCSTYDGVPITHQKFDDMAGPGSLERCLLCTPYDCCIKPITVMEGQPIPTTVIHLPPTTKQLARLIVAHLETVLKGPEDDFDQGAAGLKLHVRRAKDMPGSVSSGMVSCIVRCCRAAADAGSKKYAKYHKFLSSILTYLEAVGAHQSLQAAIAIALVDAVPRLFFKTPTEDLLTVVQQIKASRQGLVGDAVSLPLNLDTNGGTAAMLVSFVKQIIFDKSSGKTSVADWVFMEEFKEGLRSALLDGDEQQLRICVQRSIYRVTWSGLRFRQHMWMGYYNHWLRLLRALEKDGAHPAFRQAMHECLGNSLVKMLFKDALSEIPKIVEDIDYLRANVSPEWLQLWEVSFACPDCAEHCTLE